MAEPLVEAGQKPVSKAAKNGKTNGGRELDFTATLWAVADALRGSMDAS